MMPLLFAQIREDADVERAHFRGARRIVAVASGGCTALSLLHDDVDAVRAVDVNPAQTLLVRAKMRAIAALELDDFLVVAGERDGDRKGLLARAGVDVPEAWVELGLLHCGANERFYRFLGQNLRRSVLEDAVWRRLFDGADVDTQREWLKEHASDERWHLALGLLLSRTTHEHFFPPEAFANVEEQAFGRFFAERFAAEVSTRSVASNHFLHQILFGRYQDHARPAYLTPEGYDVVRRNLHKLDVVTASLQDVVTPDVDAVTVSNVFDWASDDAAAAMARHLRTMAPNARVVIRQMLDTRPLPDALGFHDDAPAHGALDRAMLYRAIHCGRLGCA